MTSQQDNVSKNVKPKRKITSNNREVGKVHVDSHGSKIMVNQFMNLILVIVMAVTGAPYGRYHNTNNGIHQGKPILNL
jgi:hypothetical protein